MDSLITLFEEERAVIEGRRRRASGGRLDDPSKAA
jgi:hypothetical protein